MSRFWQDVDALPLAEATEIVRELIRKQGTKALDDPELIKWIEKNAAEIVEQVINKREISEQG